MSNQDIMAFAASLVNSTEKTRALPSLRDRLKAEYPADLYRQMIVYQRHRHNAYDGELWQGRSEYDPAETRYPNILAELDASGFWMDRISRYAEVTPAVMAAVMEDNWELSFQEMRGLAKCFGCEVTYLAAPVLSTVDPSTNKGRARRRHLKDLLELAAGADIDRFDIDRRSMPALAALEDGQTITYATYRFACYYVQDALDFKARTEARQKRTRAGKLLHSLARADLEVKIKRARGREAQRKRDLRLSAIKSCIDSVKGSVPCIVSTEDLDVLADFAKRDLYGALGVAMLYGQALQVERCQCS